MTRFTNLSNERYEEIKKDLKALGLSCTRHNQKYACGGFQINANKKSVYRFTDEELIKIQNYLVEKNLDSSVSVSTLIDGMSIERMRLFYGSYVSFIRPILK